MTWRLATAKDVGQLCCCRHTIALGEPVCDCLSNAGLDCLNCGALMKGDDFETFDGPESWRTKYRAHIRRALLCESVGQRRAARS